MNDKGKQTPPAPARVPETVPPAPVQRPPTPARPPVPARPSEINGVLAAVNAVTGEEATARATNLLDVSRIDPIALYNLESGDSVEIKDRLNVECLITGWVATPSQGDFDFESGEEKHYPITKILTASGEVIRSGSRGVLQSVVQLTRIYGAGPWDPPLKVIPKARPLPDGRQYYFLFLVGR